MTGPTPPTVEEGMREAVARAMYESDWPHEPSWDEWVSYTAERPKLRKEVEQYRRRAEAVLAGPVASALAARERERDEARAERDQMERGKYAALGLQQGTALIVRQLEEQITKLKAERAVCDKRIRAQRAVLRAAWPPGTVSTISATRARIYAVARDRLRTIQELRAELATLRASAERMEADHAEEIARLREALVPFKRLSFSFDGFSFDPAELVVLGRCCGSFNPKEHSHLQTAITAARAALTPKEPNDG